MSYENAPATKFVATQCVCCGRALVDAPSLESGMGPVCRKKHGYNDEIAGLTGRRRHNVNKLIVEAASVFRTDKGRVLEIAKSLKRRGCPRLSEILMDRCTTIELKDVDTVWRFRNGGEKEVRAIQVFTPYSQEFLASLKNRVHWMDRQIIDRPSTDKEKDWDRRQGRKVREFRFSHWEVSVTAKAGLMATLIDSFPGDVAKGGKGLFTIPREHGKKQREAS